MATHHAKDATLRVVVRSLPGRLSARIVVTGPRVHKRVTRSSILRLPAGSYTITAGAVKAPSGSYYATTPRSRVVLHAGKASRSVVAYATMVPKSTLVVPASGTSSLTGDPSGPRMLTITGAAAKTVKVGDSLSSGVSAAAPYGYLVKVRKIVHKSRSSATLDVENTTLLAAVPTGELGAEQALEPTAEASSVNNLRRVNLEIGRALHSELHGARARASGFAVNTANLECESSAGVHLGRPTLTFSPSMAIHASWGFLKLDSASISITAAESLSFGATADAGAHCSTNSPGIGLFPRPITLGTIDVQVGPVPVTITPKLQLYLSGQASIEAKATFSLEQGASVTAGVSYEHGSYHPISSLTQHFTPAFTAEGNASGELALSPTVDTLIYDVAGPSFDVGAVAKLNADVKASPWWTLQGCLQAGLGFVIDPLNLNWSDPHLIQVCKTLLSAATPPPTSAIAASTPPTNTSPPAITDEQGNNPPKVGDTLKASTGSWSGTPTEYRYQWESCVAPTSCTSLPGAGSPNDTVARPDVGDTLRVSVTAESAAGASSPAMSTETAAVLASPTTPGEPGGSGALKWTGIEAPFPAETFLTSPEQGLHSVSCPVTGMCVAVGEAYRWVGSDVHTNPLIDTLSDGHWTVIEAPLPPTASTTVFITSLNSVSCASPTSCVAVGSYQDRNGDYEALVETLSGTQWVASEAPLPGNAFVPVGNVAEVAAELYAVSCRAPGECFAVGDYASSESETSAFVDSLNGSTWSVASLPIPAEPAGSSYLADITCPNSSYCVAVGAFAGYRGLISEWNGSDWSSGEAPESTRNNSEYRTDLDNVACASSTHCVATATQQEYGDAASIWTMVNGQWEASTVPLPPGVTSSVGVELGGPGCEPNGACVGSGGDAGEQSKSVLAQDNGDGKWSSTLAMVENSGLGSISCYNEPGCVFGGWIGLWATSCPTETACIGVGATGGVQNENLPIVDEFSGQEWQPSSVVPAPGFAERYDPTGELFAVSCTSATWCVAVGRYENETSDVGERSLIEIGEG
ncbi:MAG: hypothetical protein WBV77_13140 [Solirubrobacteraceae bacterium]